MPATQRDTIINIRAPKAQRELIDRAATLAGKSRSEFMLSSASERAEELLSDQTTFKLSPDQWNAFTAALDASPQPNERLKKTLNSPAPWEK
ncbi:MAG: DUF1778 domain-containing protein [Pseudomonadota bacterium]